MKIWFAFELNTSLVKTNHQLVYYKSLCHDEEKILNLGKQSCDNSGQYYTLCYNQ